jgi:hypothetical protein
MLRKRLLQLLFVLFPVMVIGTFVSQQSSAENAHEHVFQHDHIFSPPQAVIDAAAFNQPPQPPPESVARDVSNAASDSGQWSQVYQWPLVSVHSALMPDGDVLLFDAWEYGRTPSARLWNPNTNTFTLVPNLTSGLFCSGQVMLADGRQCIIGGHNGADTGINDTNIFDWRTNAWSRVASMNFNRWYPTAVLLGDGRVFAMAGESVLNSFVKIPEIYNPTNNSWTQLPGAQVNVTVYPQMHLLPDGRLFMISDRDGYSRTLNIANQTWSQLSASPLFYINSVQYRPGKIMMAGGATGIGNSTYVIDFNQSSPAWRGTQAMSYGRFWHNMVILPDGKVFTVGGSDVLNQGSVTGILQPEMWDPNTETWQKMSSMQNLRMYHSIALLLPDARVLVAGGGRLAPAVDYPTAEIYSPPYLFKGTRPTISSAPGTVNYGATMNVQTPDAASISSAVFIRLSSVTHAINTEQRFISLTFSQTSGGLNVQAPTNSNAATPGYYMLFLVNGSGVPSVAKIVQLTGTSQGPQPTNTPAVATNTPNSPPTATPTNVPPGSSKSITVQVNASSDDVNEDGGVFDTSSGSLWLGTGSSTTGSFMGVRFNNLAIPQNATIASATLDFYSNNSQWLPLNLQLAAELTDDSVTFASTNKPSQRPLSTARIQHITDLAWNANTWYPLDNVTSLVQEIVKRPGWQSGNSLSIIIRGTATNAWARKFATSFETNGSLAPRLNITYVAAGGQPAPSDTPVPASKTPTPTYTPSPTFTPTNTPTPTYTPSPTFTPSPLPAGNGSVSVQINAANDDVNEDGATLDMSNSSLWLGNASAPTASLLGLRFNSIGIPQNATITAARLEFYSTNTQWISINLQIAGDAEDNSTAFSATNRPSQQPLTAARVNHTSNSQWLANTWYPFDDMRAIIQEIVNRPGWQSGNSMGLILRGTAAGAWARKFAAGYERGAVTAVRLVITYTQ